jgi:hypothetical protein
MFKTCTLPFFAVLVMIFELRGCVSPAEYLTYFPIRLCHQRMLPVWPNVSLTNFELIEAYLRVVAEFNSYLAWLPPCWDELTADEEYQQMGDRWRIESPSGWKSLKKLRLSRWRLIPSHFWSWWSRWVSL